MDQKLQVHNDQLICLRYNHNEKILLVIMDDQVPFDERFLCSKCLETHQNIAKMMPINSAISEIKERILKKNQKQEEYREASLRILKEFCLKINDLQTKVMTLFNQIQQINQLWITSLENLKQQNDLSSIMIEFQSLNSREDKAPRSQNDIQSNNQAHFVKLDSIYQKLLDFQDYEDCYTLLRSTIQQDKSHSIVEINSEQQLSSQQFSQSNEQETVDDHKVQQPSYNVSQVQLVQCVKQEDPAWAIAFNYKGTIMIAGCKQDVKVWKKMTINFVHQL